ncbi:MAG TPA: DUF2235 domain-containing protein [Dehalococcoidia bacterium]|nr:DUF2235 domain-containing protein [Dehalococcoidia bacterium]
MSKNIVVCYDGTNAEYRKHNTNVVRTFEAIVRDDGQAAFYDPGVGTFSFFGRRFGRLVGIGLGMVFGYGIRQNIEDGYEYLMNTFEPKDKVFIFGFSRGAYTARALSGMIHQFGILQRGSKNLIPYVSKMYFKKDKNKDFKIIEGFKKTFSNVCKPHFIGLWDTVGALGPNLSKKFPDLKLNPDIKYGFQAISIDEKRKPYKIVLWDESSKAGNQVIEQVWFAGAHSEVGGGCSKDECSLPDLPFAWMMDKAIEGGLKLKDGWQNNSSRYAGVDMHDSCTFFPWVIFGSRKKREIPDGALVHQSVIDRAKKRTDYSPNLPNDTSTVSTDSYTNNG